jgi:hypothetical protein
MLGKCLKGLLLVALQAAAPAWAITKCVGSDGRVTYQETACDQDQSAKQIKAAPTPAGQTNYNNTQAKFSAAAIDPETAREIGAKDVQLARSRMKDPDSSKFDSIRVFRFNAFGKTIDMTCGNLNAKNSYGGYVGSKPFWVYEGVFTQTANHFYPGAKSTYLMGDIQIACMSSGLEQVTG